MDLLLKIIGIASMWFENTRKRCEGVQELQEFQEIQEEKKKICEVKGRKKKTK
jgi:hypothetical protein